MHDGMQGTISRFFISVLVYVSRDFEPDRNVSCEESTHYRLEELIGLSYNRNTL